MRYIDDDPSLNLKPLPYHLGLPPLDRDGPRKILVEGTKLALPQNVVQEQNVGRAKIFETHENGYSRIGNVIVRTLQG